MNGFNVAPAVWRATAIAAAFVFATFPGAARTAAEETWSPKLSAVYKLRLLGMEMATFNFQSTVGAGTYTLSGNTRMTWGLGLFKFTATHTGTGRISGDTVTPATYAYNWQTNNKKGGVKLGYGARGIESVGVEPPNHPGPDVVPLKPEHLRGVFDPLSALIVLARHNGAGHPCDRKIGIFEGKQRFDVVFSPLKEETIAEPKPSGQPVRAFVCRVKYMPVAGHKMNKETSALVKAEGIEVAFRPIPEARMLLPYRIALPTPVGTAVLTAQKVDIVSPANRQIALSH